MSSLGRLVYDNLKKTVLYLLPAGRYVFSWNDSHVFIQLPYANITWVDSFSELMPVLLNVLIGVPQMLSNIQ